MSETISAAQEYFRLMVSSPIFPFQPKPAAAAFILRNHDSRRYEERIKHAQYLLEDRLLSHATLVWGSNTYYEIQEVIRLSHCRFNSIVVVTSDDHQARVLLTALRAFQMWAYYPDIQICGPCYGHRLDEEADKIEEYQKKGHVASYEEGIAYLKKQPH